jgi:hypothetical protein
MEALASERSRLGRSGDNRYLGLIERYTDDKNEFVQLAAMVAIAQPGKAEAVSQLQRFAQRRSLTRKNQAYGLATPQRPIC